MGVADLLVSALRSPVVRKAIGSSGKRVLELTQYNSTGTKQDKGVLATIKNTFGNIVKLVGWIVGVVAGGIKFTASALFGMFVNASTFIWNFNFNASDQDLNKQVEQSFQALAGSAGAVVGRTIGSLVAGGVVGAPLVAINKAVATEALIKGSEEAIEEIADNLKQLIQQSGRSLATAGFTSAYINIRKTIKWAISNDEPSLSVFAKALFGDNYKKAVSEWGKQGSQPWSFAKKYEDFVEGINNPYLREFVEEAGEEFWEAFVETGAVITGSFDSILSTQKNITNAVVGTNKIVQVKPDRSRDEETLLFVGGSKLLRPAITNALATHQLLGARDVGQIVGIPESEYLKRIPAQYSITILYSSHPPGRVSNPGEKKKRTEITIHNIERSKLDWDKIKTAAGKNGYNWGRFRATANTTSRGQVVVYGASEDEAEDRLRAVMTLSEDEIVTLSITEEKKEGIRKSNSKLYKESTWVYPVAFKVTNSTRVLNQTEGIATLTGNYLKTTELIELWTETEPDYAKDRLQELLSKPGVDVT